MYKDVPITRIFKIGTIAKIEDDVLAYWKADYKYLNRGKITRDNMTGFSYVKFEDGDEGWI